MSRLILLGVLCLLSLRISTQHEISISEDNDFLSYSKALIYLHSDCDLVQLFKSEFSLKKKKNCNIQYMLSDSLVFIDVGYFLEYGRDHILQLNKRVFEKRTLFQEIYSHPPLPLPNLLPYTAKGDFLYLQFSRIIDRLLVVEIFDSPPLEGGIVFGKSLILCLYVDTKGQIEKHFVEIVHNN